MDSAPVGPALSRLGSTIYGALLTFYFLDPAKGLGPFMKLNVSYWLGVEYALSRSILPLILLITPICLWTVTRRRWLVPSSITLVLCAFVIYAHHGLVLWIYLSKTLRRIPTMPFEFFGISLPFSIFTLRACISTVIIVTLLFTTYRVYLDSYFFAQLTPVRAVAPALKKSTSNVAPPKPPPKPQLPFTAASLSMDTTGDSLPCSSSPGAMPVSLAGAHQPAATGPFARGPSNAQIVSPTIAAAPAPFPRSAQAVLPAAEPFALPADLQFQPTTVGSDSDMSDGTPTRRAQQKPSWAASLAASSSHASHASPPTAPSSPATGLRPWQTR